MTQPLGGLVVLDLSTGDAGALASMMLSDLGARVLRAVTPATPLVRIGGFVVWDRGKEAIALDISTGGGQAELDRLIPGLDVLIEDQAPSSQLQPLFGAERLKALNPHLISCSITAYGMNGPWKDDAPDDDLVLARSGMLAGTPGFRGTPTHLTFRIPSVSAAACACAGIAAALFQREESGRGRRIETSLMAATLVFTAKVSGTAVPPQKFQRHPGSTEPFYGVYQCSDGKYINLGCFQTDMVMACAELLGLSAQLRDPRFHKGRVGMAGSDGMSVETENELRGAIAAALCTRSLQHWTEALAQLGIPFAPVRACEESLDDPQVIHNVAVCTLDDPVLGSVMQMGAISRFFETQATPHRPRSATVSAPPVLEPLHLQLADGPQTQALPLAGVRILEITNIVAGPVGGRVLAELGADLVKLEPPAGDIARNWIRTYFYHLNSDKRGLCIDLRKPGGGEILRRLVAGCDAILANVRPGAIERMGIGPHLNPDLVESHITAFGWTGPYAARPGLDPMAQALTGHHIQQGGEGNPPSCLNLIAPTDYMAGVISAFNLALGLYVRRRFGIAQRIETNLLNAGILLNSAWFTRYPGKPTYPMPDQNQYGLTAFHRLYRLSNGWIYVAAHGPEQQASLLGWLGLPRIDHSVEGHPAASPQGASLEAALSTHDVAQTIQKLKELGVPAAEVLPAQSEAFLGHPQAVANDFVESQEHPHYGSMRLLKNFIQFPGAQGRSRGPLPLQGEHTIEVLAEAGFSDAEIRNLLASGTAMEPRPS